MLVLILGLVLFLGIHSVRMIAPGFRDQRMEAMGENGWKGVFAVISLVGLALIIWGWSKYRLEAPEIYQPPEWGRHANYLLTLLAFILIASANVKAGRIKAAVGHPMLLGTIFWSLGHLLANGDLASILLFGAFLVYAIADRIAVVGRADSPPVFVSYRGDVIAIVGGGVVYAAFLFWLHGALIGMPLF